MGNILILILRSNHGSPSRNQPMSSLAALFDEATDECPKVAIGADSNGQQVSQKCCLFFCFGVNRKCSVDRAEMKESVK